MSIQLNHIVILASNNQLSAQFLADILGFPAPTSFGPFLAIKTDNDVTLDFMTRGDSVQTSHYAFLLGESEFDTVFMRICEKKIPYWADHKKEHPYKINHDNGGRGLYFHDPDNHLMEILTRP
jgi:catechol 2,3-dioxygenase-like lactoylglutathione lyase family enzyme